MALKMAAFAPMPRASVITAMLVKPGRFNKLLIPNRMSLNKFSMYRFLIADCGLLISNPAFKVPLPRRTSIADSGLLISD
jgi:hypothetical protein